MTTPQLPPAQFIASDDALQMLVETLSRQALVAIDTESNSLYAYHGKVCLIQLSTYEQDYIIDPFAIRDMTPLRAIFEDPAIQKVFHAAEYDILCIRRDYGIRFVNIFDTIYAARLIDGQMRGLAELLMTHFAIPVDKRHQLDDWGKRPLGESSLQYAQMDTHFLPLLRDLYAEKIAALGATDEMREVFADIALIESKDPDFDPEGFWKLVKPSELNKQQLAVLEELYKLRDGLAQENDTPPFKMIDNRVLVQLACNPPTNRRELFAFKGLRALIVRQYADDLLEALERGTQQKPPKPPQKVRVAQEIADRYNVIHAWRRTVAQERKIESNMVLSKQTMWQLAEQIPDSLLSIQRVTGMGSWRLATYGEQLLTLLQKNSKKSPPQD